MPVAFLKIAVTFFMVSPAGTPKNERTLVMVYWYLLAPSGVAFAKGSAVPQVNFVYFQSVGPLLKLVITPTCIYTLFELPPSKFNKPWLPLLQSTVKLKAELSTGNSGVQLNKRWPLTENPKHKMRREKIYFFI